MGNANLKADELATPVTVANGGTGASTLTGVLTGNGTSAVTASAVTEGGVLLGGASNAVTDTGVLAKGTILVGDGAGAPTELAVGTNDQVLTADSAEASGVKWADAGGGGLTADGILARSVVYDDFVLSGTSTSAYYNWTALGSSNRHSSNAEQEAGHPGITSAYSTSATWRGLIGVATTANSGDYKVGGGQLDMYFVVKTADLSNGANNFTNHIGMGTSGSFNASATDPDDGIFFKYNHGTNSGNWQCITRASSTSTTNNTSTAVTTDWTTLRISINAAGTDVTFYVNGASVATSSTNIPSVAMFPLWKHSRTAGTTERSLLVDLWVADQQLTTSRVTNS